MRKPPMRDGTNWPAARVKGLSRRKIHLWGFPKRRSKDDGNDTRHQPTERAAGLWAITVDGLHPPRPADEREVAQAYRGRRVARHDLQSLDFRESHSREQGIRGHPGIERSEGSRPEERVRKNSDTRRTGRLRHFQADL